jgi:hypothetical protein
LFVRTAAERKQAQKMRREGTPLKQIAAALGVSPSTAHLWTKDIRLTPAQLRRNRRGPGGPQNPESQRKRAASWSARCRAARRTFQLDGRKQALSGDPLHLAGCMLYWAEGAKNRNKIAFSNSDPRMLQLFRRFLRDALALEDDDIVLTINVYTGNGLTIEEIERYWLDLLGLPKECTRKHAVNHMPTSSSGRAKNKLPYGVCTLRVQSTWAVQHIFGAIQEYAGFDEPRWLD